MEGSVGAVKIVADMIVALEKFNELDTNARTLAVNLFNESYPHRLRQALQRAVSNIMPK